MKILLTGASGFLGKAVLKALLAQKHEIIAFSRRMPEVGQHGVVWVDGDLSSGAGLDAVPWSEVQAVVHLAAAGVKASNRCWSECVATNVVGTQRLLSTITRQCLNPPSVFVARTFYEHIVSENSALLDNPYITTKLAANDLVRLWSASHAAPVVLGTVFQLFGPGDDSGNVLSYALRNLKSGQVSKFGSGGGMRDWLYIDDAASAVIAFLGITKQGLLEYDIGSGELRSIRSMVEQIARNLGQSAALLDFDPARDRPDVGLTLAAKKLPKGWRPKMTMDEAISIFTK